MKQRAHFEFRRVLTPIGFMQVPIVRAELRHGRNAIEVEMTVDSGADLSMIPYQVGLGLGLKPGRMTDLSGITGGLRYILRRLRFRLGPLSFQARVAWTQRDDVPMLLGRADIFDRFVVTLDARRNEPLMAKANVTP